GRVGRLGEGVGPDGLVGGVRRRAVGHEVLVERRGEAEGASGVSHAPHATHHPDATGRCRSGWRPGRLGAALEPAGATMDHEPRTDRTPAAGGRPVVTEPMAAPVVVPFAPEATFA